MRRRGRTSPLRRRSSWPTSRCSPPPTSAPTSASSIRSPAGRRRCSCSPISLAALGAALSAGEVAGVLAIAAGVLLVRGVGGGAARGGLPASRWASPPASPATRWSTTRACATPRRCPYFEAVLLLTAVLYAVAVGLARGPEALREAIGTPRSVAVGLAMFGAYALTLAALEIAEAAPGRRAARDERGDGDRRRRDRGARARAAAADGRRRDRGGRGRSRCIAS